MHEILKNKRVIFFDIGNTLDYPASGDWLFTDCFLKAVGDINEKMKNCPPEQFRRTGQTAMDRLKEHCRMQTEEEEIAVFCGFYRILSDGLGLGLTEEAVRAVSEDRARNMSQYIAYPDALQVVETLARTHTLGLISDTWPSVENQLEYLGLRKFFSFATYSFEVGAFKPDPRMFRDALEKCGRPAEETVFIDDNPDNLAGAAALGITPVLIAADKDPDPEGKLPFLKIRSLSELL